MVDRGLNHVEGGWPKDINLGEVEVKMRFRKKIEKLDAYGKTMTTLSNAMESCVKQNNTIDIYSAYFTVCINYCSECLTNL